MAKALRAGVLFFSKAGFDFGIYGHMVETLFHFTNDTSKQKLYEIHFIIISYTI